MAMFHDEIIGNFLFETKVNLFQRYQIYKNHRHNFFLAGKHKRPFKMFFFFKLTDSNPETMELEDLARTSLKQSLRNP